MSRLLYKMHADGEVLKVFRYIHPGKSIRATLFCLVILISFQDADRADAVQAAMAESVAGTLSRQATPIASDPSTGVYRLDLAESLQLAVRNNRDVQIGTLFPVIAREAEKSTASVYDPALFAESKIYRTDRPIQSILDNGTNGTTGKDSLLEDGWNFRTGVRKQLPTGGAASVYIETNHLNSNSDLVIPNPQDTSRLTFQLRQALLKEIGDTSNKANIKIAANNVKIAKEQYKKNLLGVLRDVAVSYWRFAFYYKQLDISREAVAAAEKICNRLANKKELGLANMLDIDKANAVLQNRRLNQFADNRNYKAALEQLKLLLGFSGTAGVSNAAIIPTEPIVYAMGKLDRPSAMASAISTRPEVSIAKLEINSAETEKQLARHKQLPTLDAIASYSHNALGDDVGTTLTDTVDENQASWSIGVEFEFPLGGQKSEADFRKASLMHNRKQLELNKAKEQIGFEISSAIDKIEELSAEIKAAEEAAMAYQRVVQRETTRFEINKIDNQRLLDAQDDYFQAQGNALRAALSLNIAILDLSWAKGMLIEDLHIDLKAPAVAGK